MNFYEDHRKWRHKSIPIEISKKDTDRYIDLAIYKNHYVLIKKLDVFSGDHTKKFICRRCLNSYTNENMLLLHKPKCEINDITTIRISNELHLHRKKDFQIKIHYILGYTQISNLIMRKIILV